ncbi:MAG: aa3-type cytochrome c oxidase subunit IV [Proteobacteria bacterium]|jgi:Bacterial aa3 type cytochrome c oxidase subunit IV.|nr:MAG: aa3-type cytochrome c oxidase subunit IV [Pseudomonadota bacterium]
MPNSGLRQFWRGAVSIDTSGGSPAMDYQEHIRTYNGFIKGAKWLTALVALTLILMAIFLL